MSRCAIALFALLTLLGGCSLFPLSAADCKPASWRERGYADGFAGHPSQLMRLSAECKRRFGVEVPEAEYLEGWRDGYDEWYRLMGSMSNRR